MNTAEFLQITAMVVPERDALVCGDKRVTFEQMADRVNRLANWLQSAGAGPDNPVGAVSTNGIEYVETYYAAAKIGATFVPLNYRAKHEELTYMINTSDVHVLFVGERYLDLVAKLRPDADDRAALRLLRPARPTAWSILRGDPDVGRARTSRSSTSTRASRRC